MSGGSYSYICFKEPMEFVDPDSMVSEELVRMHKRLCELGFTEEAAGTEAVLNILASIRRDIDALGVHMAEQRDIWKAVEWNDSLDGSRLFDELEEKYRSDS